MGATKTKRPVASVTVAKFTDQGTPFTIVRDKQKLGEFVACGPDDYHASGWDTPLRDATARFIRHLDSLQKKSRVVIGLMADESASMSGRDQGVIDGINEFVAGMSDVASVDPKAGGKVLCVIITDGLENASREVSPEALRAMIAERENNDWTFIYLGANQDAWRAGTSYGLSGRARGQTVTMKSNSSKAFSSALRQTGSTYAAGYLSDNDSFVGMASAMPNRSISEDGEETAVNPAPAADSTLKDALVQARKEMQE